MAIGSPQINPIIYCNLEQAPSGRKRQRRALEVTAQRHSDKLAAKIGLQKREIALDLTATALLLKHFSLPFRCTPQKFRLPLVCLFIPSDIRDGPLGTCWQLVLLRLGWLRNSRSYCRMGRPRL